MRLKYFLLEDVALKEKIRSELEELELKLSSKEIKQIYNIVSSKFGKEIADLDYKEMMERINKAQAISLFNVIRKKFKEYME